MNLESKNEVAEVLTEINKIDPAFEKTEWLRFCERDIIPNILEAFIQEKLDVLEDWCLERVIIILAYIIFNKRNFFQSYGVLSQVIKENQKVGFSTAKSQIIDVNKVELVSGKMMEHGPVLVITFQVFMIHVVSNKDGKVIEGDAVRVSFAEINSRLNSKFQDKPVRMQHVWVMCRDMDEYNPALAWKLLELHMQETSLSI